MDRQIIEISNNGFFLSLYRGFLTDARKFGQENLKGLPSIPKNRIFSEVL